MKNRKRLPALLLSLALVISLCACDFTADPTGGTASPSPDASPTDYGAGPSVEVDLSKDAVAFSAGLSGSDVLLTVNGVDIPADLFLYWLFVDCYTFEYYYYYYYGFTVADYATMLMEDTVDRAAYYTVMRQRATELGCLPTDAQVQEVMDKLLAEGEGYYDNLKTAYGLSEESMDCLNTISFYYENLLNALFPAATGEMLNNYVYQVKHILLKTVDDEQQPLSDDEIAAQRAMAEDILARLQAVEGEEQLELFDELMNEYSEDGRDGNGDLYAPDGYTTVPGEMVPEFEEASLALPIGGMSGIVESKFGFHIILRGEVEDIDSYAEDCRTYHLDQEIDALIDASEITRSDALADIDVASFYERYFAYQNAVMDAYYAASEGGDSGGDAAG